MKAKFLFLGTGSSMGVPLIGCECSVCKSKSHYNKRLRPSGLITVDNKNFLLDVGPDFRYQALKYNIKTIDGLLLTHTHYDHVGGIDDLRIYNFIQKKAIPCLLSKESEEDLKIRYLHLFPIDEEVLNLGAQFDFHVLEKKEGSINFEGIDVNYFSYVQGGCTVTGYKIGDLAYISDIKQFDDSIFKNLKGVNTLIISAVRHQNSPVHFSVEEAIKFSNEVKPKNTYFTHIAHEIDHEKENKKLNKNMQFAFDGMEIEFNYEG